MLAVCWKNTGKKPKWFALVSVTCLKLASETLFSLQLGHVYNNIFSLRLGRDKVVFITGYKMVKEALVTQAENFVDRPYSPLLNRVYSGNGRLNACDLSQEFRKKHCWLLYWTTPVVVLLSFKTDGLFFNLTIKNKKWHSLKMWNIIWNHFVVHFPPKL